MAAVAAAAGYDAVIDRQQKRIAELEADLARYSDKVRELKARALGRHNAAVAAAAAVHVHARAHVAQVQAVLALPQLPQPGSPSVGAPLAPPNTPDTFAAQAAAAVHAPGERAPVLSPQSQAEEDERAGKTRYWTEMEHNQFLYAVKLFGPKNYVAISQFVGTRTPKQVRTHAQKYQMKLEREARKRRAQAAQAAAVAAAAVPGTAAAAAAAAAVAAAAACDDQHMMYVMGGAYNAYTRESIMAGLPPRAPIPAGEGDAEVPVVDTKVKAEAAEGSSGSACTGGDDVGPVDATCTDFDMLRDTTGSPMSNDDDTSGNVIGEDVVVMVDDNGGMVHHISGAMPANTMPAPAPSFPGFRKNSSLGNLADYDDFMRKITTAVNDDQRESRRDMFQSTNDDDSDLEMDGILTTRVKSEQFEDSLLAEL